MRRATSFSLFPLIWAGVLAVALVAQNPGGNPDAKKMKNPVASSPESAIPA